MCGGCVGVWIPDLDIDQCVGVAWVSGYHISILVNVWRWRGSLDTRSKLVNVWRRRGCLDTRSRHWSMCGGAVGVWIPDLDIGQCVEVALESGYQISNWSMYGDCVGVWIPDLDGQCLEVALQLSYKFLYFPKLQYLLSLGKQRIQIRKKKLS